MPFDKKAYRRAHYLANREKAIAYSRAYHRKNRERWMFTRRIHRQKLREQVLAKFGNKCGKCGFDNPLALQVDHVAGDGKADRKKYSNGATPAYLKKILADTKGEYQLLCANCNLIKYRTGGL